MRLGLPDGVVHLNQLLTDTRNFCGLWQVVDENSYQVTPAFLLRSRSISPAKEDFRRIELN